MTPANRAVVIALAAGLAACSSGGTPSDKPVISSFEADPATIAHGSSSELFWTVTGATSLSIDNGIGTVTGGSIIVTPATTTTYTLTATNTAGSASATATVTVAPPKPAIALFGASPASITQGGSSTLSWSVTGATSLSIDNGVGTVTGTSIGVTPSATTTYTLTATNGSGSTTATATVTVNPPGPIINSFTATPPAIASGGSSTLAWDVTGATSLSIDQGVGAVTGTSKSVSPTVTTTYTLSATNAAGTNTKSVTVTVNAPAPVISTFTATPPSITAGGSSTLAWSVTGAASLSIDNGVGAVTGTSTVVTPNATTTYTLTATASPGGATATRTATVTVNPVGAPQITNFTATPDTISQGSNSTLAWTVTGATSLSIDNGVGDVSGTTSTSVSPSATTEYTLTAHNGTADATAKVTVTVTTTPALHLVYTDPDPGGAVRLVQVSSDGSTVVLDLVVGADPLAFFGMSGNLPLAPGQVTFTGMDVSASKLFPTNGGETAAKAVLPSSGPLAGTLVVGVAHRKTSPADLDQTLTAGQQIARFTFQLAPTAAAGTVYGDTAGAFALLDQGLQLVTSDIALGTFEVVEQ